METRKEQGRFEALCSLRHLKFFQTPLYEAKARITPLCGDVCVLHGIGDLPDAIFPDRVDFPFADPAADGL